MQKVSIVSPCYNKEPYIGEFLDSICKQTWDNIEVILVNDGSSDGTRDVIRRCEPRLIKRGYSVRVIDRANFGVSAAIRNGLEHVTGEFFCVPDCDDILSPEYVSKMAGALICNPNAARVVCDMNNVAWMRDNGEGLKTILTPDADVCNFDLISSFFLWRTGSWMYTNMIRSVHLPGLIKAYSLDFRQSQEPQSSVFLGYIGNIVYLPENLYFYRTDALGSITKSFNEYTGVYDFLNNYFDVCKESLKLLPIDESELTRYLKIADLGCAFALLKEKLKFNHPEEPELTSLYNIISSLSLPFKRYDSLANGRWVALNRSVSNYLIGYTAPYPKGINPINRHGRIIGYGVGLAARMILPNILETSLKPDILWDQSPKSPAFMGITVTKPDISTLTPEDTVLVFMLKREPASKLHKLLTSSAAGNVLYYYDILDYLADFYFPQQLD